MRFWKRNGADAGEGAFPLRFGSLEFPRDIAEDNFLFVGQRGSGKTLSIRLLAQSAIDAFTPGSGRRALVYDPKGDWPSILRGHLAALERRGRPCASRVKILNPFHRDGWAYDVAADFAALGTDGRGRPLTTVADGFAKALIPEDSLGGENRFWVSSAQGLFSGLVQSFARHTPGAWTFRDAVSAACDPRLVPAVLDRDPATRRILDRFRGTDETYANVLQTLASFAWDIEPAAYAWEHHLKCGRRLTCADWFQTEDILVLCGSYDPPAAVEPINGVLMNFVREHLVTREDIDWSDPAHPETWLVLDEFPKLHTIRDMADFFTLTRSKGGVQVIGFQSVTDMYERYGENAGNTILGMCGLLGILRLTCPKTAEYFESRVGSYEVLRQYRSESDQTSTSFGPHGVPTRSVSRTVSTNRQHHTLPGVLKQEFYLLDRVRKRDLTIDGWYVALGRYDRVTYSAVEAGLSPKFDAAVEPDFVPVDPALCEPRRWDEGPVTDFERLKVKKPDGYSGSERPVPPPADYLTALGTRVRTRQ